MTITFEWRRIGGAAAALAAVTALVVGCGSDDSDEPSSGSASASASASSGETHTVTTDQGEIAVPSDPQEIVVLSGSLAGYLFSLDAPVKATDTRVLGVTNLDGGFPPAWSEKATAQGTEQLTAGEALDLEEIAAADPDLIIGGGQGISAVQATEAYDQLAAIAPTVLVPRTKASWQDQLTFLAEATNRTDQVPALIDAYEARVAEVKAAITVPEGAISVLLSTTDGKPYLVPETAVLPSLLAEVGFTLDTVYEKAGEPELFGSGDSFTVSEELLGTVADAPNLVFVPAGGPELSTYLEKPSYASLPAFVNKTVNEFPASSYRPDYDGVMATLDLIEQTYK